MTPAVGAVVALTELDSEPRLLVTAVDDADNTVTGVLLADLAAETIQRLASAGDRHRREELILAVTQTTELARFCVPVEDCRQLDESGFDGAARRERESR
ncbi:hypothetical protein [Haloarcula nitratireducens]|uniref:Uncharacterized protein n=1 Tax=Haloarcula nitratireducens TaxID=2487749 RepID=A0AAW4PGU0_9EURY|nr:hypothetical protein [Halomicroarcula nitratireducens]MBX0297666.1 hypothetical protein [Halomicroarcula nitratireducens]